MRREDEDAPPPDAADEKDDDAIRALLKPSLVAKKPEAPREGEFLRGVQKRIRTRSRGKFYADGWSTSSSRVSYMVIALAMLIVIAIAYFALGPMGVSAR
jgi:hypothetical protein